MLDSVSALTPQALVQMTTFWNRFMQEPDSIRTAARRAHLREVVVPVLDDHPSVLMLDVAGLASQYPSVAAALAAAGLTARQHDVYRVALISAILTKDVADLSLARPVDRRPATSRNITLMSRNISLMDANRDKIAALAATGIWSTP